MKTMKTKTTEIDAIRCCTGAKLFRVDGWPTAAKSPCGGWITYSRSCEMVKVDIFQVHLTECQNCGEELLILSYVRTGDTLICGGCYATMKVGTITAPYDYKRTRPTRVETDQHDPRTVLP